MSFLIKKYRQYNQSEESSNFFFHFTPIIDNLINILNNDFVPFYSMENLHYLNVPGLNIKGMAFPMVCFCDIPLGRQQIHKKKYGNYGIGLRKSWGIENMHNHLTPVIYSYKKSVTSASLTNLFTLAPTLKKNLSEEDFHTLNNSISTIVMHFKPYEGFVYDKVKKCFSNNLTRFYDEREWRFIPLNTNGLLLNIDMDDYQDISFLSDQNLNIQKNNKLRFEFNDIAFIVLKGRKEIDYLLSKLSTVRYNKENLESLRAKVIFD